MNKLSNVRDRCCHNTTNASCTVMFEFCSKRKPAFPGQLRRQWVAGNLWQMNEPGVTWTISFTERRLVNKYGTRTVIQHAPWCDLFTYEDTTFVISMSIHSSSVFIRLVTMRPRLWLVYKARERTDSGVSFPWERSENLYTYQGIKKNEFSGLVLVDFMGPRWWLVYITRDRTDSAVSPSWNRGDGLFPIRQKERIQPSRPHGI